MEAKYLEETMFVGGLPAGYQPDDVCFDLDKVSQLRRLKQSILECTESRFLFLGEDLRSLPLELKGSGGTTLSVQDWWGSWERHYPTYRRLLEPYDLWAPLPTRVGTARVFEAPSSVPQRPTTNLF
jgi:hypothetical protein